MVGANSREEGMEAVSEPWTEQRALWSFSRFHRESARYSGIGLSVTMEQVQMELSGEQRFL